MKLQRIITQRSILFAVRLSLILVIACENQKDLPRDSSIGQTGSVHKAVTKADQGDAPEKFKIYRQESSSSFHLSEWRELPKSNLSMGLGQIVKLMSDRTAERTSTSSQKLSELSLNFHFCHSDREGTYLMHKGNHSPALSWPQAPQDTDHLLLFLFDLDGYFPHIKAARHPLSKSSLMRDQRLPIILWANVNLDHNLNKLPEGFGSQSLKLQGKPFSSHYYGLSLSNDYTRIFSSDRLRGIYYDYDGPCIVKKDTLMQHRILALLIASPWSSEIISSELLQQAYQNSKFHEKTEADIFGDRSALFTKAPAWQILQAIITNPSSLDCKEKYVDCPKYNYSARLFMTVKRDTLLPLFTLESP